MMQQASSFAHTNPSGLYDAFRTLPATGAEHSIDGLAAKVSLPEALSPGRPEESVDFGLAEMVLSDYEVWLKKQEEEAVSRAERQELSAIALAESDQRRGDAAPKTKVVWKWLLKRDENVWASYSEEESNKIEDTFQRYARGDRRCKSLDLLVAGKYNMTIAFNEDLRTPGGTQRSDRGSRTVKRFVESDKREAKATSASDAQSTPVVTGLTDQVIVHFHLPHAGGKEVVEGFKSHMSGYDVYAKAYQYVKEAEFSLHVTGPRGNVRLRDKVLDEAAFGFSLFVIGMEKGKEYDIIVKKR